MSSVGYLLTSSFAPVRSNKSMEAKAALLKLSHKIKQEDMMGERGGGEEWCRGRRETREVRVKITRMCYINV